MANASDPMNLDSVGTGTQTRVNSLLLVTHVALRDGPRGLQIDDQTAAGIAQWLRHFERITYFGVAADNDAEASSTRWVDVEDNLNFARCQIVALPRAYRPTQMLRHCWPVYQRLRKAIAEHQHCNFTIGGIFGDWPALASLEAARQKRPFSNNVDRVEAQVLREKATRHASVLRQLAGAIYLPLMENFTRYVLQRSHVSILQGLDVFNHYKSFCSQPYCTYDTHTQISDRITRARLEQKQAEILSGHALRIVYVGRASPMKGPRDWLNVLEILAARSIPFNATWIGDGPDLAMMKARVAASGLEDRVQFKGFVNDREVLLGAMRDSDLLLFCHKTLESPRCLIESLVCGCPLVGYGTDYSRGLVATHGGGKFVAMNDVAGLAETIISLYANRPALAGLVEDAAASGRDYNEDAVYSHRAALMQLA